MTLQIEEQVALAPLTTMGVGGPARFLAEIGSETQLLEALGFARQHRLPVVAIGGGSNLLVHDEGYPGLVLRMTLGGGVEEQVRDGVVDQTVPAGLSWDDFVLQACEKGLSGVECLAGIPGMTGGTPVQNVGAYGQEVSQTITQVRAFDRASERFVTVSGAECGFQYRSSMFNVSDAARERYLITAVTFQLKRDGSPTLGYEELRRNFDEGARPELLAVYQAVRAIRGRKGMVIVPGDPDCRSAGSFFKNPVVTGERAEAIAAREGLPIDKLPHWPVPGAKTVKLAAAWLVERAGFGKGFALGEAGISSRHSLALINRSGRATFADIARLRDLIQREVAARFELRLEQEPIELGLRNAAPGPEMRPMRAGVHG